ncbi:MAG: hypothetical protein DRJ66_04235 [Thermoprotei archaeon]|nr:MAG: hypothetical protein DRJ66_04235 [Thermoprotei archaeon]RLF19526.1 MAG: hypothetical protein DRZ82_05505 [Thermoprotei archaeon]
MFCPHEVAEILFETQMVTVRVLRKMNFKVCGIDLSQYGEGDKCRLPLWLAKTLNEEGFVRIEDDNFLSLTELNKTLWKDQHSSTPLQLPEDFYLKVRLTLSNLSENPKDPSLDRELNAIDMCFEDLVNVRLQKVFQAVRLGVDVTDFIKSLVIEERILYRRLSRMLLDWIKLVRGASQR